VGRYSKEILQCLSDLRHAEGPHAGSCSEGVSVDFSCGTNVAVYLTINSEDRSVEKVSFKSNACGVAVAFVEHVAGYLEARMLTDLGGEWQAECYVTFLERYGEMSSNRMPCLAMVTDAFGSALRNYRQRNLDDYEGDSPLVCSCFGVSEEVLERLIASGEATTVAELTDKTNAGSGCGSCLMIMRELVDARSRGF
jgi:NifU-like protein